MIKIRLSTDRYTGLEILYTTITRDIRSIIQHTGQQSKSLAIVCVDAYTDFEERQQLPNRTAPKPGNSAVMGFTPSRVTW